MKTKTRKKLSKLLRKLEVDFEYDEEFLIQVNSQECNMVLNLFGLIWKDITPLGGKKDNENKYNKSSCSPRH